MINLNDKLRKLEGEGKQIRIGIVGAGQMGKGLVSQIAKMKGMRTAVVSDHTLKKAIETYTLAGIHESDVAVANTPQQAEDALSRGKYVACEDFDIINQCGFVDVVVDATGNTDSGALIAMGAIENGKHIIMLNVETDVTVGHVLKKYADKAGVIYTGSAGDEPGAVKELYDFADAIGLEVLVIGKGKNNAVDLACNPDTVYREAIERGIAPKMLASFKDGTKTMVEMTCMSNATGFLPDIRGAHGAKVTIDNVCEILDVKENGGILNSFGVVEYVDGLAPGVFVIVTTDLPQIHHEIQYLKIGKGPHYCLYRPFHLCSLETPITAARAVLYHEPTIVALDGTPYSETITIAKRDLKAGELLDGIGGYCVYGSFERYEIAKKESCVPIGIINKNTKVMKDVKKGQLVTYDCLSFDENSPVFKLRKEQEHLIG
ncbi:MAG: NAD(P)H-dependent oxidoreductase [Anaerofustis sp.]